MDGGSDGERGSFITEGYMMGVAHYLGIVKECNQISFGSQKVVVSLVAQQLVTMEYAP